MVDINESAFMLSHHQDSNELDSTIPVKKLHTDDTNYDSSENDFIDATDKTSDNSENEHFELLEKNGNFIIIFKL